MRIIGCFLILFSLMPAYVSAFQNEPKDFRGIKWGSSSEIQKELILQSKDGDVSIFTRKNDKMEIGDVKGIKNIYYFFYKNKFFKVIINLQEKDSLKHFDGLADVFKHLYGKASKETTHKGDPFFSKKPIEMTKSWRGRLVNIGLFGLMGFPSIVARYPDGCDHVYGEVMSTVFCASYQYKPVAVEYDRSKKEQTRAKETQEKKKRATEQKRIQKEKADKAKKDL